MKRGTKENIIVILVACVFWILFIVFMNMSYYIDMNERSQKYTYNPPEDYREREYKRIMDDIKREHEFLMKFIRERKEK